MLANQHKNSIILYPISLKSDEADVQSSDVTIVLWINVVLEMVLMSILLSISSTFLIMSCR